ncbi:MAG: hypothetical protein IPM75_13300 [Candidatus Competibacteraceae bacterium]|nr:hypothetical protein [Candidatus Competibacteraceae bacterium]
MGNRGHARRGGRPGKADLAAQITDIPVLFTMVPAPLESGLVSDLGAPERNVTGTTQQVPVEAQIKAIRAYRPLTRLGVIYNPADPNSVANVRRLRELSGRCNSSCWTSCCRWTERQAARRRLARTGEPPRPARTAISVYRPRRLHRRPPQAADRPSAPPPLGLTFSANELEMRDSQAMVGLVSRFYNLGRLTALKARQILVDKKNPRDIPVESLSRFTYIINRSVAKRLALYPPMNVLSYAEVID